MKPPKFPCNDCGIDVLKAGDWYMCHPKIWTGQLGLGWNDNLCLRCLERRLGRPLRPGIWDISPASTHYRGFGTSDRLTALWSFPEIKNTKLKKRRRQR